MLLPGVIGFSNRYIHIYIYLQWTNNKNAARTCIYLTGLT